MIPVGSKVTLREHQPIEGTVIGHYGLLPIIQVDPMTITEHDVLSYTDENGKVRKVERPIT